MVEEEQARRAKAKEDSILSQLSKIYNSCDSLEDTAIVELISQLNIENRTKNISDKNNGYRSQKNYFRLHEIWYS